MLVFHIITHYLVPLSEACEASIFWANFERDLVSNHPPFVPEDTDEPNLNEALLAFYAELEV